MLSLAHDAVSIAHWLLRFLQMGAKKPDVVVCDFGKGLLNGICLAFCGFSSYIEYADFLFDQIFQRTLRQSTVVKIDICHTVKSITRWSCFSDNRKKIFFTRSICLLIKNSSLEEIKKIVILALSEYEDNFCDQNSKIRRNESFLRKKIETVDIFISLTEENIETNESLEEHAETKNPSALKQWCKKILNQSKSQIVTEGSVKNSLFCPGLEGNLMRILRVLPLWTNLNNKLYELGEKTFSSASVENYFKFVKEEAFSIITRPDEIITKHIKLIDGSLKLSMAKTKKAVSTEKMHNPELNETEIWKKNNTNKNVYLTPPMPVSYTHLTLPTTPYV